MQGLRAFAFVCIFLHHTGLKGMDAVGPYGVSVFIILSGFLMGGRYLGNNKKARFGYKFVLSKISSLYPLHIIATLLMVGILLITAEFNLIKCLYGLVVNVFMVLPYFLNFPIEHLNPPSWYLGVCVITYFVFPLLLRLMKCYRNKKYAYLSIAICVMIILLISFASKQFSLTTQKYLTYYFPIFRVPEFVIGCNMGYLFVNKKERSYSSKKYLFCIAVCITLASWYIYDNGFIFLGQEYFRNTALYLLPSVLIIYSVANGLYITNIMESKIAVIIGDLSPYAFLIHVPVIWFLRILFKSWGNDLRIVLLSFIVSLLLSLLYRSIMHVIKNRRNKEKCEVF